MGVSLEEHAVHTADQFQDSSGLNFNSPGIPASLFFCFRVTLCPYNAKSLCNEA